MKKMKVLAAGLLAAISIGAQAGFAGPGDLGTIDNNALLIGNTVKPGLLFDVYTFVLGAGGDLSGAAVSLNTPPLHAAPLLTLSPFAVVLENSSFAVIGTDTNPADGFSFSGLAAGNYALTFVGLATGSLGGAYGGALFADTTSTKPIPEPGSLAMMLAGLGAVGFVVARRRSRA